MKADMNLRDLNQHKLGLGAPLEDHYMIVQVDQDLEHMIRGPQLEMDPNTRCWVPNMTQYSPNSTLDQELITQMNRFPNKDRNQRK